MKNIIFNKDRCFLTNRHTDFFLCTECKYHEMVFTQGILRMYCKISTAIEIVRKKNNDNNVNEEEVK